MNKNIFNLLAPIMSLVIASGYISPVLKNAIDLIPAGISMENTAADYKTAQERAPLEAIGRVLTNDAPFNMRDDEMIYLYDYFNSSSIEGLTDVLSMAIVDMDADGRYEVVLKDEDGNSTVFRYEDSEVYAYVFSKKEMRFLKNDGTFVWSKDVDDNGYAKLVFNEGVVQLVEVASFKDEEHRSAIRTIGNTEVSFEEFNEFVLMQAQKDITWYTYIDGNVCYLNELAGNALVGQEIMKSVSKADEAINAIEQVLKLEIPLFDGFGGFVFLDDYYKNVFGVESLYGNVGMRIFDFDNDNIPEVIMVCNGNIQEILRYYNGNVYMYTRSNRQMNDLKTDGTFIWADSAANWGVGVLKFDRFNDKTIKIAIVDEQYCEINGKSVTFEEFFAFIDMQGEKDELKWYDYTDENISSLKNIFYNIPLDFN